MKYALEISRGSLSANEKRPKLFSSLRASYECYDTGWIDNAGLPSEALRRWSTKINFSNFF